MQLCKREWSVISPGVWIQWSNYLVKIDTYRSTQRKGKTQQVPRGLKTLAWRPPAAAEVPEMVAA